MSQANPYPGKGATKNNMTITQDIYKDDWKNTFLKNVINRGNQQTTKCIYTNEHLQ